MQMSTGEEGVIKSDRWNYFKVKQFLQNTDTRRIRETKLVVLGCWKARYKKDAPYRTTEFRAHDTNILSAMSSVLDLFWTSDMSYFKWMLRKGCFGI